MIQKFVFVCLLLGAANAYSQTTDEDVQEEPKVTLTPSKPESEKSEKLDTSESLEFLGGRLWFQVKKRLHLTTNEEEKAEKEKKKKDVKLSLFGVSIEKD